MNLDMFGKTEDAKAFARSWFFNKVRKANNALFMEWIFAYANVSDFSVSFLGSEYEKQHRAWEREYYKVTKEEFDSGKRKLKR